MITKIYNYFKSCSGVSINSKKIKSGDMFFGIKGIKHNGNAFAKEALSKGAKYVVIDNPEYFEKDERYILVKDTIQTLQNLAKIKREKFQGFVIGITGSCGKTMTKELIKAILSKKYNVYANPGNFNSHIGLPLSILSIPENAEFVILEMGSRGFGEIKELCDIAKPTHGLITNIREVHLDGLHNLKGVLKEKSALYDYLSKNKGVIFVNVNEDLLFELSQDFDANIFYYSIDAYETHSEVFSPCLLVKNNNIYLEYKDQFNEKIKTQILGDFNINNISAALCMAKFFKVNNKEANQTIANFKNQNNRLEKINKCSNTIILDAYNSNYHSLKGALNVIDNISIKNKVLILGELKELGSRSINIHKDIITLTNNPKYNIVILCGEKFIMNRSYNKNAIYLKDKKELEYYLKNNKISDSAILLKASRSMEFENLVNIL